MSSSLSHFAARLREFIQSSTSESSSAEGIFDSLALELFQLQLQCNAPYRRFCQARRVTPSHLRHWCEIAAIPAEAFKEFDLTCLAPEQRQRTFHSSGTTGQQPSRHFHSSESLSIYEASLLPWFERHLLADAPNGTRILSLTPPAAAAPNSSLAYMFDAIRAHYGCDSCRFVGVVESDSSWAIDFRAAIAFLEHAIKGAMPVMLLGTAFNFVHLIDHVMALRINLSLPAGSRVLETGGYKGRSRAIPRAELHKVISEHLGIPDSHIVTEYGMSELSSQAYDRVAGETTARLFRFPPWARAQIISPETGQPVADGQTGLIRAFDLANVWSVMAIQTADLAIARGNGFELLGRSEAAEPRGCSLMTSP